MTKRCALCKNWRPVEPPEYRIDGWRVGECLKIKHRTAAFYGSYCENFDTNLDKLATLEESVNKGLGTLKIKGAVLFDESKNRLRNKQLYRI